MVNKLTQKDDKVEVAAKIKEAAREEFLNKGFDGARMQSIADKAGINKAMLHYYYKNKKTLFQHVFVEQFEQFFPRVTELFNSDLDILMKIDKYIDLHFDHIIKYPEAPLFIISEIANPNLDFKDIFPRDVHSNMRMSIVNALSEAMDKKQIRRMSPQNVILNLMSLLMFPFVGKNLLTFALRMDALQYEMMLSERKQHIKELIINSLKLKDDE